MWIIAIDPKDIPLHRDVAYVGKPDELEDLLPQAGVVVSSVPTNNAAIEPPDPCPQRRSRLAYFARVAAGWLLVTGRDYNAEGLVAATCAQEGLNRWT